MSIFVQINRRRAPYPEGDPRVPHPPESVPALANTEAVRKARKQATIVTCVGAIVPTVLAMQGMASLAIDLLGFPLPIAIALAGFLELALVSFALLTRASALAGRPGGVDAIAVWGVSLASGLFSAAHELVGPAIGGVRSWEVDPGSLLAAGVRLAAPLVAALLWERVLTAARREHEARSLVEVRRDHRLIAVAQAALTVRQLEAEHNPRRRRQTARLHRARRKLQRSHVAALRMVGPGRDLFTVLAAVGAVDVLPAATIVPAREADDVTERTAPKQVGQLASNTGGGPQIGPVLSASELVQDRVDPPAAKSMGQVPVVAATGTALRIATVLRLVAEGKSQRDIAALLGISRSTVARAIAAA